MSCPIPTGRRRTCAGRSRRRPGRSGRTARAPARRRRATLAAVAFARSSRSPRPPTRVRGVSSWNGAPSPSSTTPSPRATPTRLTPYSAASIPSSVPALEPGVLQRVHLTEPALADSDVAAGLELEAVQRGLERQVPSVDGRAKRRNPCLDAMAVLGAHPATGSTTSVSFSTAITRTVSPGSAPASQRASHTSPATRTWPRGRQLCVTVAVRPTNVCTPVAASRRLTRRFQNPTSPAKPTSAGARRDEVPRSGKRDQQGDAEDEKHGLPVVRRTLQPVAPAPSATRGPARRR